MEFLEGQPMNWKKLRPGRPVLLGVAAAAVTLLAACGSSPASTGSTGAGSNSAAVQLTPANGRVNLTPKWSTSTACNTGYRGSAVLRIITPSGQTFSLSAANNIVTAPFSGTMLDPIGLIQNVANVPNGSTAELVVICFSGPGLTGTEDREMRTYVSFSANGFNYTSSSTAPAGFTPAPAAS
jgi:hypothetical protein